MPTDAPRPQFDAALIQRYDIAGPRYTSYPTAPRFSSEFDSSDYQDAAQRSNQSGGPLSIYIHIPFCDTVCYYCACNKIVTKHRDRALPYLDALHREIELQAEHFDPQRPVEQLHLGGGTPTFLNNQQLLALIKKLRQHFTLKNDDSGEYGIEIDPREADADTIAALRQIGFNRLSLGVQDFDPQVQKAVNRIQSEEQTLEVIQAARKHRFQSISCDLIYGLPHQSVTSFDRSLDKIIDQRPDRLSLFNYAHLPERFKPQRRIRPQDLPSPSEKLDILQHSIEKLSQAGYHYIGMDHFALPEDELSLAQAKGQLHRNFQGYSTHADCDLIALGISAIGYLGGSYTQNEKALEPYLARLQQNQLPINKGYRLNPDDKLRRQLINQLSCHFQLDIPAFEQHHQIRFQDYFRDALAPLQQMADDGLVQVNQQSLQILPPGRLLVRQICMLFDAYLEQDRQTTQYSRAI